MKDKANVRLLASLLAILLLCATVMPSTVWAKNKTSANTDAEKYLTAVVDTAALQKEGAVQEMGLAIKSNSLKKAKSGSFTYVKKGKKAYVTGYTGKKASIKIPAKIGKCTVVAVGDGKNPFTSQTAAVKSITIPKTVTSVQYGAFSWNSSLTKVTFAKGSKLESIGDRSFSATGIKKLALPDGTKTIGGDAFSYCSNLKSITLGKKLTSIGYSAFASSGLASITMPDTVVEIGDYCFYNSPKLKSASLSAGLTAIPDGAFQETGLTAIDIPGKVKTIGVDAFYKTKLKSLTIPDNVQAIGNAAFASCTQLENLTIGNSVAVIATDAFRECNLKDVTLGDKIERIEQMAFCDNKNLAKITLPATVTAIEYRAFSNCEKLSDINLPQNPTSIGGKAFDNTVWMSQQTGVIYFGSFLYGDASNSSKIDITEGTTTICDFAFDGQSALASVTIPEGVTTIGEAAFFDTGITSITIPASVTEIKPLAVGYKKFVLDKTEEDFKDSSEYYKYRNEQYELRNAKYYGIWEDAAIVTSYCEGDAEPIDGFTITGKPGSAAEAYAAENGFQFIAN